MNHRILAICATVFLCTVQNNSSAQNDTSVSGGGKILVGPLTMEQVIDLPDWFGADFMQYMPVQAYIEQICPAMTGVDIVCVLGTWCSDSKRELPRLIRILQFCRADPSRLKLIGVDRSKTSPGGESSPYAIERVPTFIFLKNAEEIGRIVESPVGTLEKNVLEILRPETKTASQPAPALENADHPPRPEQPATDQPPRSEDGAVKTQTTQDSR